MLKYLSVLALIACSHLAIAQDTLHVVNKGTQYLVEVSVPAEVPARDIAFKYKVANDKLLQYATIKQSRVTKIWIPITSQNLVTTKNRKLSPLMYQVKEGETLEQIASRFNNSTMTLSQWNMLKTGQVKPQQKILVGFLGQQEGVFVPVPVTQTAVENNPIDTLSKDTLEIVKPKMAYEEKFIMMTNGSPANDERGAAVFFESKVKAGEGIYYAFHNSLPNGTIIKVVNPANNTYVYAKVIGEIPNLNQYRNCIIGLSNNAKAALRVRDNRVFTNVLY